LLAKALKSQSSLRGAFEMKGHSPDNNGNPFAFFFQKQKIVVDSGKKLREMKLKD
jgi:hypothetical protein